MRKILISLSIIGAVAAVATGVTIALFNDTETSTGNIFTAGTMDLKVDHKYAMYDGHECTRNCEENLGENLIQNGSFEVPEVTDSAKWEIFSNSDPNLKWTVEWVGSQTSYGGRTRPDPALVEYHENIMGPAQDGDQYAELDSDWFGPHDPLNGEPALVKIHQDIPTTPGAKYKLHYYFSPRPNTGGSENIMYVNIDDVPVQTLGPVAGGGSIVWTEYTYEFTATNASTKVEFIGGGTDNSLGIFLDNVSVHPYTCQYQIVGGTCTLWGEKDLGPDDYYWHFDDVKPGDYGTNIISLHAYSNDAYACLIDHNIKDYENVCIDPENAVSDPSCGVGDHDGELSGLLKAFVWVDDSPQNNAYDNGETILYGPNAAFTNINTMARIPLTESNTKYIGIAWCFGTQTVDGSGIHCSGTGNQDIAQTDSFQSYFTVYAEQQRNNDGFTCTGVTANLDKSSPQLF